MLGRLFGRLDAGNPAPKVATIPGQRGKQLVIESALASNSTLEAFLRIKELPPGNERDQYLRIVMERGLNFTAAEAALLLTDKAEQVGWLEKIIDACRKGDREDWVLLVLEKYPAGEQRDSLLEGFIGAALATSNLGMAKRAAEIKGRTLREDELEPFIKRTLPTSFHQAQSAAELVGRKLTFAEIWPLLVKGVKEKNYNGIMHLAKLLEDGRLKTFLLAKCRRHYVSTGSCEAIGVAEAMKWPLTEKERMIMVAAGVHSRGVGSVFYFIDNHTDGLAQNPGNIHPLEMLTLAQAKNGNIHGAFEIVSRLKECPQLQTVLGIVGLEAWRRDAVDLTMKATKLMTECVVKTDLARYLTAKAKAKYGGRVSSCEDVGRVLEAVELLPNGEEKAKELEALLPIAQELNDDRESHGCTDYYKIIRLLDQC